MARPRKTLLTGQTITQYAKAHNYDRRITKIFEEIMKALGTAQGHLDNAQYATKSTDNKDALTSINKALKEINWLGKILVPFGLGACEDNLITFIQDGITIELVEELKRVNKYLKTTNPIHNNYPGFKHQNKLLTEIAGITQEHITRNRKKYTKHRYKLNGKNINLRLK